MGVYGSILTLVSNKSLNESKRVDILDLEKSQINIWCIKIITFVFINLTFEVLPKNNDKSRVCYNNNQQQWLSSFA